MIFASADGFRACSRRFRQKVAGLSMDAASTEASKDLGGMVASATTIGLSIELYLKWFRMIYRLPSNKTHDLDVLCADLPADLRASIEEAYEAAPKKPVVGEAIGIDLTKGTDRSRGIGKDHSLRSVLKRSSRVFEDWRYRYETGEPGKVQLPYEFHYLGGLLMSCTRTRTR
jgi:hypothetical protein